MISLIGDFKVADIPNTNRLIAEYVFEAGFSGIITQGFTGRDYVKPLCPFSMDSQEAVHRPFTDYHSGEIMEGTRYFKRLGKTILQYLAHPEHKSAIFPN